jgi:membrane dipeptidase
MILLKKHLHFIFLIVWISGCTNKNIYLVKAKNLAQKNIIVDGHVDLPFRLKIKNFRLEKEYLGIPIKTKEGDFDYYRAKEGGLTSPFMSIYIPSSYEPEDGKKLADSLINMISYIAKENNRYFALAKTPSEVEKIFQSGRIALPMGMENGSPISTIKDVKYFRERGISYVTLTHAKDNQLCDSSYDTLNTHQGLSSFGYQVVDEMNKQGVMVDISHVSDAAAMDVLQHVKIPVIASHSSVRKYTPGWQRNMSDEILLALKKNGGVIMINFGSDFLDGDISNRNKENDKLIQSELKRKNVSRDTEEGKKIISAFKKSNPTLYSDVQKVADHIDHVYKLIGEDHIGLGSDYDGVGDSLPTGLKDASDYPNLIAELLKRGYSEQQIEKICYKNIFRVWNKVIESSNGTR